MWWKSKTKTTANVDKDVEHPELSVLGERTAQPLRKTVSFKAEYGVTIVCSNYAYHYLLNPLEVLHLHQNLHANVYSNFIYNQQNDVAGISFNDGWINYFVSTWWTCTLWWKETSYQAVEDTNEPYILMLSDWQNPDMLYDFTLWPGGKSKTVETELRVTVGAGWEGWMRKHRWYFRVVKWSCVVL